jgi:hypothetical protein
MALISTGVSSAEIKSVYSHTLKLVQNDTLPQLVISLTDKTITSPRFWLIRLFSFDVLLLI